MLKEAKHEYESLEIRCCMHGGYLVIESCGERSGHYRGQLAAFSTMAEALKWAGKNLVGKEAD